MNLHGRSLLAGEQGATGGKTFQAINPATSQTLPPLFHEVSLKEADAVVESAAAAFGIFRAAPPDVRARLLEGIATEIEALGDELLERCRGETGLPLARLTGERGRTCGQLRQFAQVVREGSWIDARIDTALPNRSPAPRPDLRRMLQPIGPVLVFGSSNFPLAFSVAGGDTASALAAGCPVIVKAHRSHPGTSEMVGTAVSRAVKTVGLPAGLFSLVHGEGAIVGRHLVVHPGVAAVGFTGSHAAGRALFDAAAARPQPIPVFAEMSSLNPVFLLPSAVMQRGPEIARQLFQSFTLGVGQFCTKPGLVFAVRGAPMEKLLETLAAVVTTAPDGVMLSPGIGRAFTENRDKITAAQGVEVLASAPSHGVGYPSVALTTAQTFMKDPALATEAFGPFTLVVLAETPAEMLACARTLAGQLTATVHGEAEDFAPAAPLLALLEQKAGRLVLNGFPTGVEVSPAMNHGGPYPATTDVRFTSVGTAALQRFARPVCYQNFPESLLPEPLGNGNARRIMRLVNGTLQRDDVIQP